MPIACRLVSISALAIASTFANAQHANECGNAATTIEVGECLRDQFSEADSQLNEAYKEALRVTGSMESFGNREKNSLVGSLRSAQRAWVVFRDRECEFHYDLAYPGTAAALDSVICKVRVTRARTAELTEWASYWRAKGY